MLFGLSVGLAVALLVYLQNIGPAPLPAPDQVATEVDASRAAPPPESEPEPAQESPDETNPDVTELEFYELLQTLEVAVPTTRQESGSAQQLQGEYTIQAGAFTTYEEADSRRATLALFAIDSEIVNAIVENEIWHRVIIGPLSDIEEIDRILRRLRSERIETLPPQQVSD